MARPDIWMPFYGSDYQDDTGHCSALERGAYMDLLWACWKRKNSLPAEDAQLMRLARCTPDEWESAHAVVMAFFYRDGDVYRHNRVGKELAIATTRYERKVAAGQAGGKASGKARAKQSGSKDEATVQATVQAKAKDNPTQLQPHSPNGEIIAANAAMAQRAPKPPKGTRLAADWKPCQAIFDHGASLNLTRDETAAVCREFREYFLSPDATRPVKRDWDGACKRWITRDAPRVVARRPRGQQPRGNRPGAGSVFAALSANLEAGDLGGSHDAGTRMGRGNNGHRVDEGTAGTGPSDGTSGGGTIVDADDFRRVPESTGEAEADDEGPQRIDRGHSADADGVRGGTSELPGGRGSARPGHAEEPLAMVAGVVGIEGPAGPAHSEAPPASGSLEEWEIIPEFLRRT